MNRLERLNLGTIVGKAKVLGTLMGIGGAMLLTFYKGAEIDIWSSHLNLLHDSQNQTRHVASPLKQSGNRLLGFLLALGSCSSFALWLIIQVIIQIKDSIFFFFYFSHIPNSGD